VPSGERAGGTLLYLTDRDDEFDSTYATYYFRFPDWVKLPDTEAVETPAEDGWKPFFKAPATSTDGWQYWETARNLSQPGIPKRVRPRQQSVTTTRAVPEVPRKTVPDQ
jgi:hypothetical protein